MCVKKYIKAILDLLFPHYCLYCRQPGKIICSTCLKKFLILGQIKLNFYSLEKIICCFDYRQPEIKKAIHFFKYPPYQKGILDLLFPLIKTFFEQNQNLTKPIKRNNFVLVPIPLTKRKKAQRGFNQSELFAKKLSQEYKLPLATNLIKKIKNTPSQTKLKLDQRKNNVKDIFEVQNSSPRQIILIDDVLTTGATLSQAAKILKQAGATTVWAIVLAKG